MGWKIRGGRRYLYRSRRDGSRVVSEYVGSETSELTALIAEIDALAREEREAERAYERQQLAALADRLQAEDAPFQRYHEAIDLYLAEVLTALGYRRVRNEWRKRRACKRYRRKPNPLAGNEAPEASQPPV